MCSTPGCPVLVPADARGGRCVTHERQVDRARGTTTQRGYGAEHQRMRTDYQQRMDAGERFICWRCATLGKPHDIDPNDWQLGHDDRDRSIYRGPECSTGNQATASRRNISPDA